MRKLTFIMTVLAVVQGISPLWSAEIVRDHRSDWKIQLEPMASRPAQAAASELQDVIFRATGAKLPVVKSDAVPAEKTIVVGGKLALAVGIDVEKLPPESFRILARGGNIYVAGRDTDNADPYSFSRDTAQTGTLFGAADFLEKFLDARWFFPGETGEYLPKRSGFSVPDDYDFTGIPKMEYRRMHKTDWDTMTPHQKQNISRWYRRNRWGRSADYEGSHSWLWNMPAKKYFRDHPDWFALVHGKRAGYAVAGVQLCTTNSKALDEFARVLLPQIEKNRKHNYMISIGPNDGGGFCMCPKCRALDVGKLPDGHPILSDRMVVYANEMAKRINAVYPDQTIGLYAYSYYSDPPAKQVLDPHVKIMHVQNDFGIFGLDEAFCAAYRDKKLKPWKAKVGKLYHYDYTEGTGNYGIPASHPTACRNRAQVLDAAQVSGFAMNFREDFYATALNNYLELKLCWYPASEFDAIYNDAMEKCYGARAVPYVQKYFDEQERRALGIYRSLLFDVSIGAFQRMPSVISAGLPGLRDACMPDLQKALSLTGDSGQRARIQMLIENLENAEVVCQLYVLGRKILNEGKATTENLRKAIALARTHRAYVKKLESTGWLRPGEMDRQNQKLHLNMDEEPYRRLLNESMGGVRKTFALRLASGAVTLDGKGAEAFWKDAPTVEVAVHCASGDPAPVKASVKVAASDGALYLLTEMQEPQMDQLRDAVSKRNGPVWDENCIEFFFDPQNGQREFRQLLVNSIGTIAEVRRDGQKELPWASKAEAAVTRSADRWTVEVRIPFAAFGRTPKMGEIWGFNVCRDRIAAGSNERLSWSPTFGKFDVPGRFGKLIFR